MEGPRIEVTDRIGLRQISVTPRRIAWCSAAQ
jgi:hypothetical protein